MIRIARPAPSDAALAALALGEQEVTALIAAVARNPQRAGGLGDSFQFESGIYGHPNVKEALTNFQHGKCAYCEGRFLAFSYGDTEHYRPKTYSQQKTGGRTIRPGYYWLAYTWSNLHFSCEKCNRARKRNVFPLRNSNMRARSPADDLTREDPLLIDPTGSRDPADHIRFKGAVPQPEDDIGETTIDLYGLDRIPLTAARLVHLQLVDSLLKLVALAKEPDASAQSVAFGGEAEAELARLALPDATFSAMTRDYLKR